jgi:CRP-like cAMP-binding protein
MNHSAATRIDDQTQQRANRVLRRTQAKMADLLRIGLLRVIEEFEARGTISSGDGVTEGQPSNLKRQTSTPEPPPA